MGFLKKILSILGFDESTTEPKREFKPVSLKELVIEKSAIQLEEINKENENLKAKVVDTLKVEVPKEEKPKRVKKPSTAKKPDAPKKPRKKKQ